MDSGYKTDKNQEAVTLRKPLYDTMQADDMQALYKYLKENEYFTIAGFQSVCRIGYLATKKIRDSLIETGILLEFVLDKGCPIAKEKIESLFSNLEI